MAGKISGRQRFPFILILVIAAGLWQLTPLSVGAPARIHDVLSRRSPIVAKVLPIGAVGIIGITVQLPMLPATNGQRRDYHGLERAEQFVDSGLSSSPFMIARGLSNRAGSAYRPTNDPVC